MVIDSSAVMSVLLSEDDAEFYAAVIESAGVLRMSAVSRLELTVVMGRLKREAGLEALEQLMQTSRIEVVPFDSAQLALAQVAWWNYGKGRHAARLNIGDCCSYALAKATGEPLLYQGNDFGRTDLHCITAPRTA
jgi:ribonuclease VapC